MMNKRVLKIAVSALFIVSFLTPVFADEIDDRLADAKKNGLPVLIEFGASWCIPCQQLQPAIKKIEADYKGRLSIVAVDMGKRQDLVKSYGIRAIPTLVFLDEKGKEFKHLFGAVSYDEIAAALKTKGL